MVYATVYIKKAFKLKSENGAPRLKPWHPMTYPTSLKLRRVIRLISRATSAVAAYAEISIRTKLVPHSTAGLPVVFT